MGISPPFRKILTDALLLRDVVRVHADDVPLLAVPNEIEITPSINLVWTCISQDLQQKLTIVSGGVTLKAGSVGDRGVTVNVHSGPGLNGGSVGS